MEGDAGASRLNPNDTDALSSSEVTAEDSAESEVGADHVSTANVGADQASTETTAEGLSETKAEDLSEARVDQSTETNAEDESDGGNAPVVDGNPSRLGRGWLIGITAALLALAGGVGTGGYFAMRANHESQAIARHDAAALKAAKECVAATQAPDIAAMVASEQKIVDCSTGVFRSQAILYSSLFVEAYQAANAHVQVSDMRAAVERNNADGSVDVLVALRVKVSNSEAQNKEAGYRLRVTMAPDEGQYRIAKLGQVSK
ncbi:MAG: Mce protein [Mycobacterium sp.]|nr:Mce protein [Mycobacterium sp.]